MQFIVALVILAALYAMIIRTPAVIDRMEADNRRPVKNTNKRMKQKGEG